MIAFSRRVAAAYADAFRGLPRATWLLSAVALINRSGTMVLPFLALYLTRERGLDAATAGLYLGLYGLGALGGAHVGGGLADRLGALRIQRLSLMLSGLAFFLLGALESPAAIAALLFVLSVIAESFRPANAAYLAATAPPHLRVQAFALNRLAINLGMAIGPAAGGYLVLSGYHWLFVVDGSTCLLAALVLCLALRAAPSAAPAPAPVRAAGPWRDRLFLACMLVNFVNCCVFLQCLSTVPLYWAEAYRLTEDRIGLLFAINPVLIVLFEMLLVRRVRRRHPLRVIALGVLLTGAGYALMPLGRTFQFAACATVVWTLGEMLESPLMGGFVANRAPDRQRGRYMGVYMLSFAVAFVVAPALGTAIYQRFGAGVLFASLGLLGLVSCLACLAIARAAKDGFAAPAEAAAPAAAAPPPTPAP